MPIILNSKPLVEQELKSLTQRCSDLKKVGVIPNLKVILVGNNSASVIYTNHKKKFCESIGAECEIIQLPENIDVDAFKKTLSHIADDDKIHGCLIQLPVTKALAQLKLHLMVPEQKDVDGFHFTNIGNLYLNAKDFFLKPCTPMGVMNLLSFYKIPVAQKNAVIIGRSAIVGKPMALMLLNANATVTICHSQTINLESFTRSADLIISAIGRPKFLNASYIDPNRKTTVIDVGINRDSNGKLCGDVDFDAIKNSTYAITPVPGGVSPLTVLSLAQNLLQAAENSLSN